MASRVSPVELAVMAVRKAIREGASEAEAYVVRSRGLRVGIQAGRIHSLESSDDAGIGVRVAVGKRLGFAYATGLDPASAQAAAERAVRLARAQPEDPYWSGLPEPPAGYPEPRNTFSVVLAETEPETLLEDAKELISHVEGYSDRGIVLSRASISVGVVERAIANSNGVYGVDSGTYASVMVSTLARTETHTTPAIFEFESSRVQMPSVTEVADRAIEKTLLASRIAGPVSPGRYTVVMMPQALAELLEETVAVALNGEAVVRGRSPYRGKIGEKVMYERITIVDDGLLKGGDATARFDGEGVPMSRKVLVEKGVLKGFVYDTYWGRRAGAGSTGNAVRGGYASTPSPGFSNVVVEPGDASLEELLEGRVIVVYSVQGAHTSNAETGEYGVLANPAILYENGEPRGWLPGLMIGGKIYDELLNNVEAVGKTVEKPFPGIMLPPIRLRGIAAAPRG